MFYCGAILSVVDCPMKEKALEEWEEALNNITQEQRDASMEVVAKLASIQPMPEDLDYVAAWKGMCEFFGGKWEE